MGGKINSNFSYIKLFNLFTNKQNDVKYWFNVYVQLVASLQC